MAGNDSDTELAALKAKVLAFARERDWEQFHTPKNLAMALAAETGELMEHFQWLHTGQDSAIFKHADKQEAIRDELADILIYTLEFANIAGIDLTGAVHAKMAKNAAKYPVDKAKGTAAKYTEL